MLRVRRQAKQQVECKRGCPAVLQRMARAYESFGKHTGKTAEYRRSSYPNPKDPERSPKTLTGKLTSTELETASRYRGSKWILLPPSLPLAQNQWNGESIF